MGKLEVIQDVFNDFCGSSSQNVSFNKSLIHVSVNINCAVAENLRDRLSVPLTQNFGKCLGFLVILRKVTSSTYKLVMDTVYTRLAGWKAQNLSLAGQITLVKSVLSSTLVCTM